MKLMEPALSLSLKNILLATDLTSCSDIALKYAMALARFHSSQVYTIHVEGPDGYQLLLPEAFSVAFRGVDTALTDMNTQLNKLVGELPRQAPEHSGQIWQIVTDVIDKFKIDLLVLATHGRTGLARIFGGSIAEFIFRNVSCPVLTVGPEVKPFDPAAFAFRKILLATDFDPHSGAPMYATWLANDFKAQLTVANVSHVRSVDLDPADIAKRYRQMLPENLEPWTKPEIAVEYGNPADGILSIADTLKPDLLVIGARHPEPARLTSHILWETAGRLVSEARFPVLTVRERHLLGEV